MLTLNTVDQKIFNIGIGRHQVDKSCCSFRILRGRVDAFIGPRRDRDRILIDLEGSDIGTEVLRRPDTVHLGTEVTCKAAKCLTGRDVIDRRICDIQNIRHVAAHLFPLLEVSYELLIAGALIIIRNRGILAVVIQNTKLVAKRIDSGIPNARCAIHRTDKRCIRILLTDLAEKLGKLRKVNLIAVLVAEFLGNVAAKVVASCGGLIQQTADTVKLAVDTTGFIHFFTKSCFHFFRIRLHKCIKRKGLTIVDNCAVRNGNACHEYIECIITAGKEKIELLGNVADLHRNKLNVAADLFACNLAELFRNRICIRRRRATDNHQGNGWNFAVCRGCILSRGAVFRCRAASRLTVCRTAPAVPTAGYCSCKDEQRQ